MHVGHVDGFLRALSAHEVTPPPPRPEEDRAVTPSSPVVLCSCIMWIGFPELSLQARLPPGLKKAGL